MAVVAVLSLRAKTPNIEVIFCDDLGYFNVSPFPPSAPVQM